MKNFFSMFAIAVLAMAPLAVSAQQLILGTGTTSASSSGVSVIGNIGSAAAIAGFATTNLNVQQNQSTTGAALGATTGLISFSGTTTTATGSSNVNSTSAAIGLAAAGNGGAVTVINGSDASAFAGFGFTFP